MKANILARNGKTYKPDPIDIDGTFELEGQKVFAHEISFKRMYNFMDKPTHGTCWSISEWRSGGRISTGGTREEAIENARAKMKAKGPEGLEKIITDAIAQYGFCNEPIPLTPERHELETPE